MLKKYSAQADLQNRKQKTEKGKQGRYKKLLEELHLAKDVVAPEILNNENAKLIFDKLIEIESLLKSKII